MLYPIEWLKEFVEIKISAEELSRLMNLKSFETVEKEAGILEVETLPNRGDSMSMIGLARDISAILKTPFKDRLAENVFGKGNDISKIFSVEIKDKKLCPRYMAAYLKGVKIKPSSAKIQKRLVACGIRPINNVVDATNYILLERGQPLHAFDAGKISGKKIIVRPAAAGEEMITLDGMSHKLSGDNLVIADAQKPVALAGIMGGANSEVSDATTEILLESACFSPLSVRRTSFKLGLRTEASIRFEKGLDFENVALALAETAALIKAETGGEIVAGFIDEKDSHFYSPRKIPLRVKKVAAVLGVEISADEISRVLTYLGFQLEKTGAGEWLVTVPGWRFHDVEREIDFIEEIIRIHGYDSVPATLPTKTTTELANPANEIPVRIIRHMLVDAGYCEAVNFSLGSEKEINYLNLPAGHPWRQTTGITNPLTEDHTILYPTLLIGLLKSLAFNQNRQLLSAALFELNHVFVSPARGKFVEDYKLAAALLKPGADFFELKGLLENIFSTLRLKNIDFQAAAVPFLHPGKSAEISAGGRTLGFIGEILPAVAANFDLNSAPLVLEISLDGLLGIVPEKKYYRQLPKFPAVLRDIAIIIDKKHHYQDVLKAIVTAGAPLLEKAELFDIFSGAQVPAGFISLAFSLSFRHPDRTLVDEEVALVHARIINTLADKFGARLR